MKKLVLVLFLFMSIFSYGQNKTKVVPSIGMDFFIIPVSTDLIETNKNGVGFNVQLDVIGQQKLGISLMSGYNFILAKPEHKSLVQFPFLAGLKYRFNKNISLSQFFGSSFLTNDIGFRFTYSPVLSIQFNKLTYDLKFTSSVIPGHEHDLSTVSLRVGYLL